MIKSPLRYPGGKSRAVKFLSEFIPPFDELREVFFGGGSLSFYCINKYPDKKYKASDLNFELYCFWQQLKQNSDAVIEGVQSIFNTSKNDSREGKHLFETLVNRRTCELSNMQRAIDFFVLNRITFSGVVDSGGFSRESFEGRFTQSAINRLHEAAEVIKKIKFHCEDYTYLVAQEGKNVFMFLDPPYYSATKSKLYGKKGILHTQFDHALLYEALKDTDHKWLMTYDNSDYIKEMYTDFFQIEWNLQYGMTTRDNGNKMKKNELLIANYNLCSFEK